MNILRLMGPAQSVEYFARRLRGDPNMALRIGGVPTPLVCRTSGSDRLALWQVFGKRHLEVALPVPPRLIVDGGANVGYASVYFANRYPDAKIIAIEPDPKNCAIFRKNCAAYTNVELIEGALWTSEADLVIENPEHLSWGFRVSQVPAPTAHSLKGVTIGGILRRSGEERIDLLKLDIEGAEEQLFSSGYGEWIERVGKLMVETHGARRQEAVLKATEGKGFEVSRHGEHLVLETTAP